jgi:glycosyltransferase involved in cell wall biosynthesis
MTKAILTICLNEADIIRSCINNWKGKVDKHLVLLSTLPWNGSPVEADETYRIAKEAGAEVIMRYWEDEAEQRNWGLAYLYKYDYVLIVDPDELYTEESQIILLNRLNDPLDYVNRVKKPLPAFACEEMVTYWKTTDYILDPKDSHLPIIAIDPKQVRFTEKRACRMKAEGSGFVSSCEPISGVITHHMSWVKTDSKVKEKIEAYAHAHDFNTDYWFENVWKKWTPDSMMEVRPYGIEKSVAVFKPAPKEIVDLMKKS